MARRPVLIASIVGLALRLAWLWHAHPAPVSDFEYYRHFAEVLLDRHQLGDPQPSAARVPAYPLFLAGAMLLSRSVGWLSLLNVLLSTALIPLVARVALLLGLGTRDAVYAAFLCAFDPTFVFFAPVLASEHLFVLLLFGALVVVLARRVALAGLLFGAATLTRPDALFYAPIFLLVTRVRSNPMPVRGLAVFVLVAATTIAPWLVRNRLVVGPGTGLSTFGGLNFYYAHNDRAYGWHPVQGTPLEGLDEVQAQRRGYEIGLAYLARHGSRRIVGDTLRGTQRLYSPSAWPFALYWSTRTPGRTPDENRKNRIPGHRLWRHLAGLYRIPFCGALLSVIFIRRVPSLAAVVLYGLVAMNWFGHCVIFWADPRYRYVAEVVFCILTAVGGGKGSRIVEASVRRLNTRCREADRPAGAGRPSAL